MVLVGSIFAKFHTLTPTPTYSESVKITANILDVSVSPHSSVKVDEKRLIYEAEKRNILTMMWHDPQHPFYMDTLKNILKRDEGWKEIREQ